MFLSAWLIFGLFASSAQPASATNEELAKIRVQRPEAVANILGQLEVRSGFRVELVACEPAVQAPVAMAFDEDGRLYVAEMRDFENRGQTVTPGRIRLLEDPDSSGMFQQSTIFANNLPWPSALACYDRGVFVAATPDIIYFKDTTGTGIANQQRVVFSGFGGTNTVEVRRLLNSFNWGPDNRIYGSSAGLGGVINAVGSGGDPMFLSEADFSFDPRSQTIAPESGPSLSGQCFDAHGRRYVSDYTRPVRQSMYAFRYKGANPFFPWPPEFVDVATPAPLVYGFKPLDKQVADALGETNALTPMRLTEARGIAIYGGSLFSTNYHQNVFVPDAPAHVIHRLVIRENGLAVWTERAKGEQKSEFLASRDPDFRPVQVINGPDGALYVADMTGSIERGRIYRIVPENFRWSKFKSLGALKTHELVPLLAAPNGWHRETTARLLYERQDPAAPAYLTNLFNAAISPLGRARVLEALASQGELKERYVLKALRDRDDFLRERGVKLVERLGTPLSGELLGQLRSLAADKSPRVRHQLACTIAALRLAGRVPVLLEIVGRDITDQWTRAAVLAGLEEGAGEMLARTAADSRFRGSPAGQVFLRQLAEMIGTRGNLSEVNQALGFLDTANLPPAATFGLLAGIGEGLHRTRSSLQLIDRQHRLDRFYGAALGASTEENSPVPGRIEAMRLVAVSSLDYPSISDWYKLMLGLNQPPAIYAALLNALGSFDDPRLAPDMIQRWRLIPPAMRPTAAGALLARTDRSFAVLEALAAGALPPTDFLSPQLDFLRTYIDYRIRENSVRLFGPSSVQRPQAMEQARPALKLRGEAARGHEIFLNRCAACHRLAGEGVPYGPDLATARGMSKERLLEAVIEPGADIAIGFSTWVFESKAGDISYGIKRNQNPDTLTLWPPYDAEVVWPLVNASSLQQQSWSVMPAGLEAGLTPQNIADLLEYVSPTPDRK